MTHTVNWQEDLLSALRDDIRKLKEARAADQAEIQRLRDELGMAQRTVTALRVELAGYQRQWQTHFQPDEIPHRS